MSGQGFFPLITHPTRPMSNTLIDNIFTNVLNRNIRSGLFITDISDHLPVFTVCTNEPSEQQGLRQVRRRFFTEDSIASFKSRIATIDWDEFLGVTDGIVPSSTSETGLSYNKFLQKLTGIYNSSFPYKKIVPRKRDSKPWITPGLINACHKKNLLYKNFLSKRTLESEQRYKRYKNKLTSILRRAEKAYYSEELRKVKGNIKNTWDVLKRASNRLKKETVNCTSFQHNSSTICHPAEISQKFNEYFVNVGPSLAKNITKPTHGKVEDFLKGNYINSMLLTPVDSHEVLNVINSLKWNKATGYDDINVNIVKLCSDILSRPLSTIINESFSSGIFPTELKIAKVIALFKSGNRNTFTNYRPVSILPVLSKIFEKLFYKRLVNYINSNTILNERQYGFREKSATAFALIDLMDDLTNAIDNREYTVGVFIDLKKAFDTLDHDILLRKLDHYGVRGLPLQWLRSYLQNRSQFVSYNSNDSSYLPIRCGVPQGSILGPLLFIIYINDLCNVSDVLKFFLFADDTNIFYSDKSVERVESIINENLKLLAKWFQINKLSLNLSKTKFIVFKGKQNLQDINLNLKVNNSGIDRVRETTFLGVIIDENLTWQSHISHLECKIAKNIGVIYRVKNILERDNLYILYCALVLPYLYYCSVVWGLNYKSRLYNLTKLQKKVIRIVDGAEFAEHTSPIFLKFKTLKLGDIIMISTCMIMYRVSIGDVPSKITNMFSINSIVHNHNTRQQTNLHIGFARTKLRSNTLRVKGAQIWNDLPEFVKNKATLFSFKKSVKYYLIASY